MLCGYLVVILFALYTFSAFTVFRHKDKAKQDRIFVRQRVCIFMMHFILSMLIYMIDFNTTVITLYALQVLFFIIVIIAYQVIYEGLSKLVLNNMLAFMSISFVFLERIDITTAGKQLMYCAIGMGMCLLVPLIIKSFPYFDRLTWVYAGLGIVMLASLIVVGTEKYGAKNWLSIGGIMLQPLEFVKILFVFFIAAALAKGTNFKKVVLASAVAGLHIIILVLEKDLGGALIYFITYLIILVVASGNVGYLFAGLGAGTVASLGAYFLFDHVQRRISAWRDPWSVIDGAGYQVTQSLFAIAMGGWFGLGVGQGKPDAIPVVRSDFIFSAISEELGGVFVICLLLVYISSFIMVVNIAMKINVLFYKLVALGLGVMFIFQVFLAVGGVIKFIPSTGVTLPLISAGGSSVLGTIILFSIIQGMYVLYGSEVTEHEESEEDGLGGEQEQPGPETYTS